jgi:hypothetical protein
MIQEKFNQVNNLGITRIKILKEMRKRDQGTYLRLELIPCSSLENQINRTNKKIKLNFNFQNLGKKTQTSKHVQVKLEEERKILMEEGG